VKLKAGFKNYFKDKIDKPSASLATIIIIIKRHKLLTSEMKEGHLCISHGH
jgi:hypothetical protein